MGVKRTKEKKKADKPSFDKTALAQLTSKIDKSLADSEKERPPKRKRQRETDEGQEPKRRQTQPSDSKPQGDSSGGKQKKQTNALLDEILALGGNEDDLELVANVDSGDEGGAAPRPKVSSEPGVDKSLKDELAQFASSLGFSKFQAEDPATDEESEDAEESDAAEEEEGEEEEEEPSSESEEEVVVEKEITKTVTQPQEARQGKKAGQLVSKQFWSV
jgi:ribosome biogenesis protein MAK21